MKKSSFHYERRLLIGQSVDILLNYNSLEVAKCACLQNRREFLQDIFNTVTYGGSNLMTIIMIKASCGYSANDSPLEADVLGGNLTRD